MDIGAISKGKYKGKGQGKYKGKKGKKGNKGKGYGSYGQHQQGNYTSQSTKGKGKVGQGMPSKGQHDKGKGKSYSKSTGQEKDMSFVTSLDNQVTQWRTAEFQYTTSMTVHRTRIRMSTQHNSGTKHPTSTTHTGGTTINHLLISHGKW